MYLPSRHLSLSALAFSLGLSSFAGAQATNLHSTPQITERVDDASRVVLHGNTRPEATAANDLGLVSDSMPLGHLQIILKRSDAQQAAAEQLLKDQADPASPRFHTWLSNEEVAERFGANAEDVDKVKLWLQSKGFTVNSVSLAEGVVEFSGNAGLVRSAFNSPLHTLKGAEKIHFGNINDPEIPAALAKAVQGIAALNNYMPHPLFRPKAKTSAKVALGYSADTESNYLSAGDLAKIYNFDNIFQIGFSGKGQTVVVIEDTNLFSFVDWAVFRKTFGLEKAYPDGTLSQIRPSGPNSCQNPGVNGDDGEAALDVEWASAAAPNAAIVTAACADTETQFGGFLALGNLLHAKTPPTIVSISYGEAEANLGSSENAYISNLYQTAALQGVSLYVASGDEGAASADPSTSFAYHGIAVSGFTSTPYNVSVGGTDVGFFPFVSPGTYFGTTNSPTFVTAKSYIPEVPWNDSCAGSVVASFLGLPVTGPNSVCSNYLDLQNTAAGSGGPSACATGDPTLGDRNGGIVSGSCKGYAKPTWQSGVFGNPNDHVRDVPDVSLMASNGFWGSYYPFCWSDTANGGTACGADPGTWSGAGGTSFASPIWAGIQALINQRTKTAWGNPNPVLYALGRNDYGTKGNPSCNSVPGVQGGAHCNFHDITIGDIAVDCIGPFNCYTGGSTFGVLSTSTTALKPAYPATDGWDFATGLGTANVFNVVSGFAHYTGPR